jgi:hypothetical protein
MSAWIEIDSGAVGNGLKEKVALYMSAWIEILYLLHCVGFTLSRTLFRYVLVKIKEKHRKKGRIYTLFSVLFVSYSSGVL